MKATIEKTFQALFCEYETTLATDSDSAWTWKLDDDASKFL